MPRQYVAVKFRPSDKRTYTYHHDAEPVAVGDEVKVAKRGDGWNRVAVVGIGETKPVGFETKAILGLAPPKEGEA